MSQTKALANLMAEVGDSIALYLLLRQVGVIQEVKLVDIMVIVRTSEAK